MELEEVLGRSMISRICRLLTFNLEHKQVGLRYPNCASKIVAPKFWVDVRFCMAGDPLRKNSIPWVATTAIFFVT